MQRRAFSFCLLIFIISACSNNKVYDEVQSLSKRGWQASEELQYTVNISDTSKAYNVLVHLRNSSSYEYSNLWLFVTTTAPNGEFLKDTIEFTLAEPDGKWMGSGLGSINSMLIPYKMNVSFPNRGIYTFNIQQAMRKDMLEGIMDVGIRVEERN